MAPIALTVGLFWLAVFHVLPAVLVLHSNRAPVKDRNLWAIGVLFASWLAFIAFMIVTTLDEPRRRAEAAALNQRRRSLPSVDISDHRNE